MHSHHATSKYRPLHHIHPSQSTPSPTPTHPPTIGGLNPPTKHPSSAPPTSSRSLAPPPQVYTKKQSPRTFGATVAGLYLPRHLPGTLLVLMSLHAPYPLLHHPPLYTHLSRHSEPVAGLYTPQHLPGHLASPDAPLCTSTPTMPPPAHHIPPLAPPLQNAPFPPIRACGWS